jgi:sigma-B regulation protein RsbU (phosphoserine phosphatase)
VTFTQDRKSVLVVDDTPAYVQLLKTILKEDCVVHSAASGELALQLTRDGFLPDLILLDVTMAKMNGYEVCAHLKSALETRAIPVIFLTGNANSEDEFRGFQAGAVDYIYKPFSHSIVKARVRTHLALSDTRQQLANQLLTLNEELALARQVQLSILPHRIPAIDGLDIAARYLPVDAVAGDFYDFLVVDNKHIGIFIADVSGHGLPAALVASMLPAALSAQRDNAADPVKVLSGLNQNLYGRFQARFVTAAYAFLDLEKNLIKYAGAGHPPSLLCRGATGSALAIQENGLMLGPFPDGAFSSVELELHPGDQFLLYTDGILEAENAAQEGFGIDRLRQFLESPHDFSSGQFTDALLHHVSHWSGRHSGKGFSDDITLLAIRFKSQR